MKITRSEAYENLRMIRGTNPLTFRDDYDNLILQERVLDDLKREERELKQRLEDVQTLIKINRLNQ